MNLMKATVHFTSLYQEIPINEDDEYIGAEGDLVITPGQGLTYELGDQLEISGNLWSEISEAIPFFWCIHQPYKNLDFTIEIYDRGDDSYISFLRNRKSLFDRKSKILPIEAEFLNLIHYILSRMEKSISWQRQPKDDTRYATPVAD